MCRTFILLSVIAFTGCTPTEHPITVQATNEDNFVATMPDGTTVTSEAEYETAIDTSINSIEEVQSFALTISDNPGDAGGKGIAFGRFRLSLVPDMTFLGGCIQRRVLHLKLVVEATSISAPMIEIDVMAFFNGTTPCFAFMNTGFIANGWCQKFCANIPKDGIKKGAAEALKAAGVTATVAVIASQLIAPVLQKAFVLVPVVAAL